MLSKKGQVNLGTALIIILIIFLIGKALGWW